MTSFGHHVEIEQVGDVTIVRPLKDNLDHTVFEHLTRNLYRAVDNDGCRKVVLNLRNVRFFFSEAVGLLLAMQKRLESSEAGLRLCEAAPAVMDILTTARLDSILTVDADEQSSIDAS